MKAIAMTHLDVKLDAETEKNVDPDSVATAFAIMVLPGCASKPIISHFDNKQNVS